MKKMTIASLTAGSALLLSLFAHAADVELRDDNATLDYAHFERMAAMHNEGLDTFLVQLRKASDGNGPLPADKAFGIMADSARRMAMQDGVAADRSLDEINDFTRRYSACFNSEGRGDECPDLSLQAGIESVRLTDAQRELLQAVAKSLSMERLIERQPFSAQTTEDAAPTREDVELLHKDLLHIRDRADREIANPTERHVVYRAVALGIASSSYWAGNWQNWNGHGTGGGMCFARWRWAIVVGCDIAGYLVGNIPLATLCSAAALSATEEN